MKDSSTECLTVDDRQSDISLWIAKGSVSSPLLPRSLLLPFLETFTALKDTLNEEEKERRRRQTMNRRKNEANSFSLLLLKGRGAAVRKGRADWEGETAEGKSLSLPFNTDKTCPEPTGRVQRSEAAPDRTGHGLAVAHHYRTINHYHTTGARAEAPPHAGGSPLPQDRPGETKNKISARRPIAPLSRSSRSVSTPRHR